VIVVAGWLEVDPATRDDYLRSCRAVIAVARATPGCVEFQVSADALEVDRVNVFEMWDSQEALDQFRGSGPDDEQAAMIVAADVRQYQVAE
jgi:quinol monooxygenase YgiN